MKKLAYLTFSLGVFALLFAACGKYEDGPTFSLASKKARVANEWVIEKNIADGVEQELTGYEQYYSYIFEKDGTGKFKVEAHTQTYNGVDVDVAASETAIEWRFDDKKEKIQMRMADSNGQFEDWDDEWSTILRLTSSEFWLQDQYSYDSDGDGTDDVTVTSETHLKSK